MRRCNPASQFSTRTSAALDSNLPSTKRNRPSGARPSTGAGEARVQAEPALEAVASGGIQAAIREPDGALVLPAEHDSEVGRPDHM